MEFITVVISALFVVAFFMVFMYVNRGTMFKKQKPVGIAFGLFIVFAFFFTLFSILFMFLPDVEESLTEIYRGFVPFLYP